MRMPGGLAVPLSQTQVDAANELHARLRQWQVTDAALAALAERFPEWSPEATLLKVAAVNQLYATRLFRVLPMSEHVTRVMASTNPRDEGASLVERIAALPKDDMAQKPRRYISFASKLAHFFIDAERFPILDEFAKKMVEYHLRPKAMLRDEAHPYLTFVANLNRVRTFAGLTCTSRELDRYLWLAGQYRAWRRKPDAEINGELRQLFMQPSQDIAGALTALLGA